MLIETDLGCLIIRIPLKCDFLFRRRHRDFFIIKPAQCQRQAVLRSINQFPQAIPVLFYTAIPRTREKIFDYKGTPWIIPHIKEWVFTEHENLPDKPEKQIVP